MAAGNGKQIAAPGQFCPILTMTSFMPRSKEESSHIVKIGVTTPDQPKATEPEAIACQGPSCAWFVPIHDAGKGVVSGSCAMALFPTAIGMLNQSVRTAAGLDRMTQSPASDAAPTMTEKAP